MPPSFDDAVLVGNTTPCGFVMLFDGNFNPLRAANAYLHSKFKTENRLRSQVAYADDLAQWFKFVGECRLKWDRVALRDIEVFRNVLAQEPSAATGRANAPATVARRVGTVLDFYAWAHADRRIDEAVVPLDAQGAPISPKRFAHAGTKRRRGEGDGSVRRTRLQKDEDVNPIAMNDLRRILERLGPDPRTVDPSPKEGVSIRDRVMTEVALFTGMRVMEVCGLTSKQLEEVRAAYDPWDPFKHVPLKLTKTKGNRKRTVLVHCALIAALVNYSDVERPYVLKKIAEQQGRKPKGSREPKELFLNHASANARDAGRPVTADTVSRLFSKAVKACGLYRFVDTASINPETGLPRQDPLTGEEVWGEKRFAKHTFHDLRHTFATQFYMSEVKVGNLAPWKRLQTLLGHRLMSTTMDIYVRHCDVAETMHTDEFAKRMLEGADAVIGPAKEDVDAVA